MILKKNKNIVYSLIDIFIYLIICDVLLFFCCKIDILSINILHIFLVDFCISIFFVYIYNVINKKYYNIFLGIVISILNIIYILQIFIYNTFSYFFSYKDIFTNARNVIGNFAGDMMSVILSNLYVVVIYIVLEIIFIYFHKVFNKTRFLKNKQIYNRKLLILLFFVSLGLSILSVDKTMYNFNTFLSKNGVKSSIFFHNMPYHNVYDIKIEETVKEDNNEISIVKEEKKYNNKHILNIDFDTTMADDVDMNYFLMNNYIESLDASFENEYTGLFKGKNLILICAEAFSKYIIDKELTPTLYRLYNNGFKFTDFYQPCWYGGTSGGEYSILTGLVPTDTTCSTLKVNGYNMGLTIFNMLKKDGYVTGAFHNGDYKFYDRNISHDATLGFDYFLATGNGLENITGWYCGDDVMIDKTFPLYSDMSPFAVYYMTLTGHAFYNDENYKVRRYIKRVKERYGDKYSDQVNNYLCAQLYLEDALKLLIDNLDNKGILDDTVICIVPDHYPYGLTNSPLGNPFTDGINYIKELYDIENKDINSFDRDKNAWILWCSSLENEDKKYVKTVDYPTFSLDVLPTLLNLFGQKYDSRLLVGNDVFSDYEHLVFDYDENYITDDVIYFNNGMQIPKNGVAVSDEKIKNIRTKVHNKILFSKFVLDNDYYDYVYKYIK